MMIKYTTRTLRVNSRSKTYIRIYIRTLVWSLVFSWVLYIRKEVITGCLNYLLHPWVQTSRKIKLKTNVHTNSCTVAWRSQKFTIYRVWMSNCQLLILHYSMSYWQFNFHTRYNFGLKSKKKTVKIQTVKESLFIDQNRHVISFFKAIVMVFRKIY